MNDWQAVKAAHATDDTFQGRPLLWVEQFGRRFAVVDIEGDGPYAGHNASTFAHLFRFAALVQEHAPQI